jgi:hypothetical protein
MPVTTYKYEQNMVKTSGYSQAWYKLRIGAEDCNSDVCLRNKIPPYSSTVQCTVIVTAEVSQ